MKKSRKHLFIATPVHSWDVSIGYCRSLTETVAELLNRGIPYTHYFNVGNALVHDARNRCVAAFMASPATDLLFIDADMGWEARDAVRLALSPQDVVGGAYRQKRDEEMYNVAIRGPGPHGLLQCDYIGTGFLKISRKAIERLQDTLGDRKYGGENGEDIYAVFDTSMADGKLQGEDALFCRRWRELGGECYCIPDMTLTHFGTKPFEGNLAQLAARMAGKAA